MQADDSGSVKPSTDNPMNHVGFELDDVELTVIDFFNIPSPHAGDVLARLVRAGVDPNTCLQYAMNQPRFSDDDIGLVVGWCLDEGADYQHVLQSERLSPVLQAIVDAHPSYRRDVLGSLVERQDTPGRRTAL